MPSVRSSGADRLPSVSREAMTLKQAMQPRLLATFLGTVSISIVPLGVLFHWVL